MKDDSIDLQAFKGMMRKMKPNTSADVAVDAFNVFRSGKNIVRFLFSVIVDEIFLTLSYYILRISLYRFDSVLSCAI